MSGGRHSGIGGAFVRRCASRRRERIQGLSQSPPPLRKPRKRRTRTCHHHNHEAQLANLKCMPDRFCMFELSMESSDRFVQWHRLPVSLFPKLPGDIVAVGSWFMKSAFRLTENGVLCRDHFPSERFKPLLNALHGLLALPLLLLLYLLKRLNSNAL